MGRTSNAVPSGCEFSDALSFQACDGFVESGPSLFRSVIDDPGPPVESLMHQEDKLCL